VTVEVDEHNEVEDEFLGTLFEEEPGGKALNFDRIEAVAFKQFPNLDIQLRPQVNLMAGPNNAGKSTALHAMAVWEFCRFAILMERGPAGLEPRSLAKQGLGIGDDEFSPINLPSLKHLWTNLRPAYGKKAGDNGYTLKIIAHWKDQEREQRLGFALALANDRLFLRLHTTTLSSGDRVPAVAYLPTLAGVTSREERLNGALRRRRIGEGLAGAVLRNVLLDMYSDSFRQVQAIRASNRLVRPRSKQREELAAELREFRLTDPWEKLQESLREVFACELSVEDFEVEYHTFIRVLLHKGEYRADGTFERFKNATARDLMVEGYGFLQWLSVLTLALSDETDILLLDEPDAHLHPHLQTELFRRLKEISELNGKKIAIATHSSDILKEAEAESIVGFHRGKSPRYLKDDSERAGLLSGIGSSYLPRFDRISKTGRVFFHEGTSDLTLISLVASKLGKQIDSSWVGWQTPDHHKERRLLYRALKEDIPNLEAISLRDRDNLDPGLILPDLRNKGEKLTPGFRALNWKRRHIEAYLVVPRAIAAAMRVDEKEVRKDLAERYNYVHTPTFTQHECSEVVVDLRGKDILAGLGVKATDVAKHLLQEEIADDLVLLIGQLDCSRR
jgi:predicted ATPase